MGDTTIMSRRVEKIIEVAYENNPNPPRLTVRAKGEVPSIGWTNKVLHRRVYSSLPARPMGFGNMMYLLTSLLNVAKEPARLCPL